MCCVASTNHPMGSSHAEPRTSFQYSSEVFNILLSNISSKLMIAIRQHYRPLLYLEQAWKGCLPSLEHLRSWYSMFLSVSSTNIEAHPNFSFSCLVLPSRAGWTRSMFNSLPQGSLLMLYTRHSRLRRLSRNSSICSLSKGKRWAFLPEAHIRANPFQSSRRLYTLRMQLNLQFDRTRKAQLNERKAADSKRRLTSWVSLTFYLTNSKFVEQLRVPW